MATKKRATKKALAAPSVVSSAVRTPADNIAITISGPAEQVQRVISEMHFERPVLTADAGSDGLSIEEGRRIAREQTRKAGVKTTDALGAPPINFVSQDLRNAYKDRCLKAAEDAGYLISDENKIPNEAETKVFEVGDALSKFST